MWKSNSMISVLKLLIGLREFTQFNQQLFLPSAKSTNHGKLFEITTIHECNKLPVDTLTSSTSVCDIGSTKLLIFSQLEQPG